MNEPLILTEMDFSRTDSRMDMAVESHAGGEVRVVACDGYDLGEYILTLQQVIQLRDFLNRHIDSLALVQIGASAERSSDDPAQLPAEHVVAKEKTGLVLPPRSTEKTVGRTPFLSNFAVGWNEALDAVEALNKPAMDAVGPVVPGCGKPLLSRIGHAGHCGCYPEENSLLPVLCVGCGGLHELKP